MAVTSIDIKEFKEKFESEYEFLYDNRDRVAGYHEAVAAFDDFVRTHGEFLREFCRYRGDLVTSDRECVAFMFALDALVA